MGDVTLSFIDIEGFANSLGSNCPSTAVSDSMPLPSSLSTTESEAKRFVGSLRSFFLYCLGVLLEEDSTALGISRLEAFPPILLYLPGKD